MKPNILLITIDSLRKDFVGIYNQDREGLTPRIDSFAKRSTLFRNAIAQGSYTRSSIPSLFTSTYPSRRFSKQQGAVTQETTLATFLKREGYFTAFFHSNPFLSLSLGYDQDFDVFDDSLLPWKLNLSIENTRLIGRLFRLIRKTPYLHAENINKKVFNWLKSVSKLFFLWVHYMDPHGPYQSHDGWGYIEKARAEKIWQKAVNHPESISDFERKRLISSYEKEVMYVDEAVGSLLRAVEGFENDMLIVLASDHGEQFGEHGEYSHVNEPYEELINVPLVIRFPDLGHGKGFVEPVALLDIVPTVLDYLEVGDGKQFDGISLLPWIRGERPFPREYVISESAPDKICLRKNQWKYIVRGNHRELYNLTEDPNEEKDISSDEPGLMEEFDAKYKEHLRNIGACEEKVNNQTGEPDNELRKRLEDLGYL